MSSVNFSELITSRQNLDIKFSITIHFPRQHISELVLIQILKQRLIRKKNSESFHTPMMFLDKPVTAASVQELFSHLDNYLEEIPEKDRWNLHYTLCECEEGRRPRKFVRQTIIPFDIDGIDIDRIPQYIEVVLSALKVNVNDTAIVQSGNGLHFLIGTSIPIENKNYFKETANSYKIVCRRINRKLDFCGLPGSVDEGIWSAGHTLRLPGTLNIKTPDTGYKNKNSTTECTIIKFHIEDLPLDIVTMAKGDHLEEKEGDVVFVKGKSVGGSYPIDTNATLEGCGYLNYCKDSMDIISYNQWHAMINTMVHLKDGDKLIHEWSAKDADRYDPNDTQDLIERAKEFGHPRTCRDLNTRWDGCKDCPHYQKVNSPVDIKGDDYIRTEANHFREIKIKKSIDSNGNTVEEIVKGGGAVCMDDLIKAFKREHPFCSDKSNKIYVYKDNYWNEIDKAYVKQFVTNRVWPLPGSSQLSTFYDLITTINYKETSWFESSTDRRLNLKNGVLDFRDFENIKILPHSKKYAFQYCLDYEYDPYAECPRFDLFLKEVTKNRSDLACILTEYMGYAFSNSKNFIQKALILLGEGSNGKSTFIKVMQNMADKNSYTSYNFSDINNEFYRVNLMGKLFNISEETPNMKLTDSSHFKNIVGGGMVSARVIHQGPKDFEARCKLIFSANKLPHTIDTSHGFFRRLLIVPFDARFDSKIGNIDPNIDETLLNERPGILNKILEGFKALKKRGSFIESKSVDNQLKEFRLQTDAIASFFEEEIVVDPPIGIYDYEGESCKHLLFVFNEYCKDHGHESRYNNTATFSKNIMSLIGDGIDRRERNRSLGRFMKGVFIRKDLDD